MFCYGAHSGVCGVQLFEALSTPLTQPETPSIGLPRSRGRTCFKVRPANLEQPIAVLLALTPNSLFAFDGLPAFLYSEKNKPNQRGYPYCPWRRENVSISPVSKCIGFWLRERAAEVMVGDPGSGR